MSTKPQFGCFFLSAPRSFGSDCGRSLGVSDFYSFHHGSVPGVPPRTVPSPAAPTGHVQCVGPDLSALGCLWRFLFPAFLRASIPQ